MTRWIDRAIGLWQAISLRSLPLFRERLPALIEQRCPPLWRLLGRGRVLAHRIVAAVKGPELTFDAADAAPDSGSARANRSMLDARHACGARACRDRRRRVSTPVSRDATIEKP